MVAAEVAAKSREIEIQIGARVGIHFLNRKY